MKIHDWLINAEDVARLSMALLVGLAGLLFIMGAAAADLYLHQGIETGSEEPFVVQPTGRELATNADLSVLFGGQPPTAETLSKLDGTVQALQAAGFRYVRLPLSWSRIEAQPGALDWTVSDAVIDSLVNHQIAPVVVLADAPDWIRSPLSRDQVDAPPTDLVAWTTFVSAVAERYRGKIRYYQIWDLPNRSDRWGGVPAPASEYQELLAVASNSIRTAAPNPGEVLILVAELDPVADREGGDLEYLEKLYGVGAKPFFDIVTVRLDGGTRSAGDRRASPGRLNLSRATLFRSVMVDHKDAAKPIWASRYGWEASEATGIGLEEQAELTVEGLNRAREEWPWMGLMFQWSLLPDPGAGIPPGRALVDEAGVGRPVYSAISNLALDGENRIAPTGYVPTSAEAVEFGETWTTEDVVGLSYVDPVVRTTTQPGASVTVHFRGSGLVVYLRLGPQAGPVAAEIDGEPVPDWQEDGLQLGQARDIPVAIVSGLDVDEKHSLTLKLNGEGALTVGGAIVTREIPSMWPVVLMTATGCLALFLALREMIFVLATRFGHLQRRGGVDFWPALPTLSGWQPTRNA